MKAPISTLHSSLTGLTGLALLGFTTSAFAQAPTTPATTPTTPAPPQFVAPKRIPPPGITLSETDRAELTAGAATLRKEIDALTLDLVNNPSLLVRIPDVEVFHKAVDWALRDSTLYTPKEVTFARHLLGEGNERARQLRARRTPWLEATGLVVRGYRSKIDGSVQPYGLVVPENARTVENRLMVWLLGRGEKRTELAFLAEREGGPAQLTPQNTMVLVPYGRFCNATKFAGETDVFEALEAVRADYRIDPARTMVGGFSMGGGSAWHLATHYPGLWSLAAPGAGFAETAQFTKALAPGKPVRPWWEQKLWAWYDATLYAANFANHPVVAYSGEIDGQKQAADIMEKAMAAEGLKLEHFIGPQTAHKYHPETQKALTSRIEELLAKGRDLKPRTVHLTTYTLRYPQASWVRIEGMGQHWERADVQAQLEKSDAPAEQKGGQSSNDGTLTVTTKNVTALSFPGVHPTQIIIDGQPLRRPNGGWDTPLHYTQKNGKWTPSLLPPTGTRNAPLRKRPGLTGPVDDAFMEGFLFVRPTGQPFNATVGDWAKNELSQATMLWRDVYRGEAPIKDDSAISEADIANKNLVLWGDPSSNALLKRIIKSLPLKWDANKLVFRGQTYDAAHHAPILIFPNPLNPQRYVVLNSGIDLRSEGYGNNALQTPKLPDWAVIDLREPPGPRWPGKITDAGFFNEEWK